MPGHAPSLAGEGRLAVGAGDLDAAIALFQRAADILPLPEYVIALAEAQAAAGRPDEAARNFKLARAEIQLFEASGRHRRRRARTLRGRPRRSCAALELAEAGYAATPTVRAADALAWALHRLGRDDEAKTSARTRRSGWARATRSCATTPGRSPRRSAMWRARAASSELSLSTDPGFSAAGAAEAWRILESLPD